MAPEPSTPREDHLDIVGSAKELLDHGIPVRERADCVCNDLQLVRGDDVSQSLQPPATAGAYARSASGRGSSPRLHLLRRGPAPNFSCCMMANLPLQCMTMALTPEPYFTSIATLLGGESRWPTNRGSGEHAGYSSWFLRKYGAGGGT